MPRILILNSAHGKNPVGSEGWVQATLRATRELAGPETVFLCSTEPIPWDLAAWLAARSGSRVELILKGVDREEERRRFDRLLDDFGIDRSRVRPRFLDRDALAGAAHPKDAWQIRDRIALTLADLIYPVAIRPEGRLERLLGEHHVAEKVRNEYRTSWTPNGYLPRYSLSGLSWRPLPVGQWLVHWTRTCPGPWPGERSRDFFRDLFARPSGYVRNAAATLARIVTEGRIRGSAWRISGGGTAVAFTGLTPGEVLALMRWRKRYTRYTFEPYGIAVRRETLVRLGAREVSYSDADRAPSAPDPVFTHAPGAENHWTAEREWRLAGDFDLTTIQREAVRIIVPDEDSARDFDTATESRFPVHVLFQD